MSSVVENKLVQIEETTNDDGLFCDGDWIESKDQDPLGSIRLIQLADIGDGFFIDKSSRYVNQETSHRLKCTNLKKGDILVSRLPDPLGRCCIFPLEGKYITAVDVCIIRVNTNCSNIYTTHMINSPEIRNEIWRLRSGTTRQRITRKKLGKLKIPLPPLEEQKRIVAKIDGLFAKIDKAISLTEESLTHAKNLLPSVLKEVFEGLERQGVPLVEFEKYTKLKRGHNPPKSKFVYEPKEGYVRFLQIRDGSSDKHSVYVPISDKLQMTTKDDLLLVAYRHVGKVFRGMVGAFNVALCKISVKDDKELNLSFLYYLIQTSFVKGELLKRSYRALIPSMSVQHLKSLNVPIPSLKHQVDIVDYIEDSKSKTSVMLLKLEEQLGYLKQLKSSILSKAFKGEL